jgi:hypothetical protein
MNEISPAATSPPAPRTRLRRIVPPSEAPAATASTDGSWNGSRASGSPRLTSGITANASASRATPRTPGIGSAARSRGLRPLATFTAPSLVRTAAAHCVGP